MIICFIGDSLTQGIGDPEYRGWPSRLCALAKARGERLDLCNLGVRSNRTNDILARLSPEAAARIPHQVDPDGRIVLSFGGADASAPDGLPRVDAVTSAHNATLIIKTALAFGPTLVVGPPPMADPGFSARTMVLNQAYARAAQALGASYLDVHTPLSGRSEYLDELKAGDGVHPGADGYTMLAALVDAWEPWNAWVEEARNPQEAG